MDFGKRLKDEREKQGFTLDNVEQETKIRKLYIKAIEDQNFNILPPRVYATGFVKRYAKFLNLDEAEIVEQFKVLAYPESEVIEEEPENVPTTLSINKVKDSRFNFKNLAAAVAFVIIAVWLGNMVVDYLTGQGKSTDTNKPPVTEQPAKQQTPKPGPVNQVKVNITANQKCWLQIKVDDVVEFEGIMQPGDQKDFTGKNKVYINAGNAGGLSVKLNNKNVQSLGKTGEVVEYELLKDGTIRRL